MEESRSPLPRKKAVVVLIMGLRVGRVGIMLARAGGSDREPSCFPSTEEKRIAAEKKIMRNNALAEKERGGQGCDQV